MSLVKQLVEEIEVIMENKGWISMMDEMPDLTKYPKITVCKYTWLNKSPRQLRYNKTLKVWLGHGKYGYYQVQLVNYHFWKRTELDKPSEEMVKQFKEKQMMISNLSQNDKN